MGAGFGDVDNDGFLDAYLATGTPGYSGLMPNVLYKNVGGRRFEDATTSSGTGHLQKGHGVSFADYDGDGDLDLFVETGGAVPGDKAANLLFKNPGHGRHWLKVKLVGTRTNRAALGARLRVDVDGPAGKRRSVYRQVGGGASYGGNGLVELVGLGDAAGGRLADRRLAGRPGPAAARQPPRRPGRSRSPKGPTATGSSPPRTPTEAGAARPGRCRRRSRRGGP